MSEASPLASSPRLCLLSASVSSPPSEMQGALVSSDFTSPALLMRFRSIVEFVSIWSPGEACKVGQFRESVFRV